MFIYVFKFNKITESKIIFYPRINRERFWRINGREERDQSVTKSTSIDGPWITYIWTHSKWEAINCPDSNLGTIHTFSLTSPESSSSVKTGARIEEFRPKLIVWHNCIVGNAESFMFYPFLFNKLTSFC